MKKVIFTLFICAVMLCACNASNEENESGNAGVRILTGSAVTASDSTVTATGSAVTASGAAAETEKSKEESANKTNKKAQKKKAKKIVRIVTDETGEQRKLKMETVNEKKKGIYLSSAEWVTNYAQVQDGHYYYIRGNWEDYTIYQDKGKKVGEFSLKDYINTKGDYFLDPLGVVRYKKKWYILFNYWDLEDEEDDDEEDGHDILACVDLKEKNAMKICEMTKDHLDKDEGVVFCNFYQDFLYYNSRDRWDAFYEQPGTLVKSPLKDQKSSETITATTNLTKAKPYLTYIDDKIYYGVQNGKKVTLYSYDLESGQEKEIFCYMRNDNKRTTIFLDMDEDYIYCQEYLIPRSGGKMIKAFADAKVFKGKPYYDYTIKSISYSYNKKYIFYIDKNYKVHRIDKKTGQNRIISDLTAAGVDCTEDSVYVKVHAEAWYDKKGMWEELYDDDEGWVSYNGYSDHLYYMDIDGKNVEKIWNGEWEA